MERPRPDFQVIGFVDHTALIGPKMMQREEQILKGHTCGLPIRTSEGFHPNKCAKRLTMNTDTPDRLTRRHLLGSGHSYFRCHCEERDPSLVIARLTKSAEAIWQ